jgi:predicted AlkP superfamily phosphohydrolase/phosphomutase
VEVFYINTWLHQQGYLEWLAEGKEEVVVGHLGGLESSRTVESQVDWARTTAYALTPSSNGIHIAVAGQRGSEGITPQQYEGFRLKLMEELRQFTDPVTGQPVVTRIWTREEAFPGSQMDRAPDLTISLRDQGFVSILRADEPLKSRPEVTGTHRPEGIFIAGGPWIRSGASLPPLSILSIAPLLLYSLGLPIPEDLEEGVPAEAFKPSLLRDLPVQVGMPTLTPNPFPRSSEEEEEAEGEAAVLARLKALGYIE